MKNPENHDNEYFANVEQGLIEHEITPKNRLENQIRLGAELFVLIHPEQMGGELSTEDRNTIMNFWVDEGYSQAYRSLEDSEEFKFHPRLQGDIFKITPQDVVQFKETGELPA